MAAVDTVKGRYSSYKLLNEIGHGGSARVYRAQDIATKKDVAVKQLFGNQSQDREDWLREVDALNALSNHHCPHVVQYLDHMQQQEKLFLVEEYAEQGSLMKRLRQDGPLPEVVVADAMQQVLATLQRMAQWGILHGDLKASNLLIFEKEVVKLTDFALRSRATTEQGEREQQAGGDTTSTTAAGNGKIDGRHSARGGTATEALTTSSDSRPMTVTSTTASSLRTRPAPLLSDSRANTGNAAMPDVLFSEPAHAFRGSVYWAAPEVLAGESAGSVASDIWSVGCTAYELLTGAPPFFDRSIPNATHHILTRYYAAMAAWSNAPIAADAMNSNNDSSSSNTAAPSAASKRDEEEKKTAVQSSPVSTTENTAEVVGVLPLDIDPELNLTEECVSFLWQCLHFVPSERPSAAELLQHPWFMSCVVPRLLKGVQESRGAISIDEPLTASHTNVNSNQQVHVNGVFVQDGVRRSIVVRWVELNLLSSRASRCAAWLKSDALPLLIPVLTPRVMTPAYIGDILRVFAQFAESGSPLVRPFLDRLGATPLWSMEELTSACDEDHLVSLYTRCCAVQSAEVSSYTPTDARALAFVLRLEKAKVVTCVRALHTLSVGSPSSSAVQAAVAVVADEANIKEGSERNREGKENRDDSCPASAEAQPGAQEEETEEEKQEAEAKRRLRAQARLLRDGTAALLCGCVEAQCRAAFLAGIAPPLQWATMELMLEVLGAVEKLPGGQALLWGLVSEGGNGGNGVVTVKIVEGNGSTAAAGASTLPAPVNSPLSATPRDANLDTSATATTSATNTAVTSGRSSAAAQDLPSPASNGFEHNGVSSGGIVPPQPPPPHAGQRSEEHWSSSLPWLLAVQEAAHHGCPAGVMLLHRYLPLAVAAKSDYLEKAGASLAATLVLVSSTSSNAVEVRCTAVDLLPILQHGSLRAARYLRDPLRCLPLFALTLRSSSSSSRGGAGRLSALTAAMIASLQSMTTERPMLAACAACPWLWQALVVVLRNGMEALQDGDGVTVTGTETSGVGPSTKDAAAPPPAGDTSPVVAESDLEQSPVRCTSQVHSNAALLVLSDVLSMVARWLAEVPPATLRGMAVGPRSSPSGMDEEEEEESSESVDVLSPVAAPTLLGMLRALRRLLTKLAERDHLRQEGLIQQVETVLSDLTALDTPPSAPK